MNQQELLPVLKPSNKPRRLTVGYAYTDTPGVHVPNLRLCGRWLQEAGFVIHPRAKSDLICHSPSTSSENRSTRPCMRSAIRGRVTPINSAALA